MFADNIKEMPKLKSFIQMEHRPFREGSRALIEIEDLLEDTQSISAVDFSRLIRTVTEILKKEVRGNSALRVKGRILFLPPLGEAIIIGDLHGDFESLAFMIRDSHFLSKAQTGKKVFLIFLGDYGDRGKSSVETYFLVLRLKELFPENVILVRGNHEGPKDLLPATHDLPSSLQILGPQGKEVYEELQKLFELLYTVVIVEDRFVLIHGCFPTQASSIEDLAYAHETHPEKTCLEELLWSDPEEGRVGFRYSPRGAGKLNGINITERFLTLLSVKALIRGHQSCEQGFKSNHQFRILTLFSTNRPPYKNKHGAYLVVNLRKTVASTRDLEKNIRQF